MVYRDIPEEMRSLVEPVIADHGYELMNVEAVQGGGPTLLRVTIDSQNGDGRIPVDKLALISREIESGLDAADLVGERYRLEVSSPGLDRMLAREKDFLAARGSEVRIRTRRPLEGRRKFRGELLEFADGVAVLALDGESVEIPFDEIDRANTVYLFSSADFRIEGSA